MTDWLLHTLIATSALIVAVLLLRGPARRLFGSRIVYGLWLIPAARFFMPTLTETVERSIPARPSPESVAIAPLSIVSAAREAVAPPSLLQRIGGWPTLLLILWLTVAAGLFIGSMIIFYRDRRAILRSSARNARLGPVRLIHSSEISSPVALGILRPIIALPSDFSRLYTWRERRLVLEHELSHHRSGDLVAKLFAFVLLCLQWFNPLAWLAHAAFRFDQEAACDARVLDKAPAAHRASYGCAIAKAASGRALLFASALDRPTNLQRRLQSMLRSPSNKRVLVGRLLIVTIAAAALPLTAGHALEYIDMPAPAPNIMPGRRPALPATPPTALVPALAARSAPAPATAAAIAVQAAPSEVARPAPSAAAFAATLASVGDGNMAIDDDGLMIDGQKKRWEDLTPAERAKAKEAVARARSELANSRIDPAMISRALANVPDQKQMVDLQRQLTAMRSTLADNLRKNETEMLAHASGAERDAIEAGLREGIQSIQTMDFSAVSRAVSSIDRKKIADEVAGAQRSMDEARAELDKIDARIDSTIPH